MPRPATTQPTSRIAAAPNRRAEATSTSSKAPSESQRPGQPIAGAATERAAPSAILTPSSVPAPQFLLRSLEVRLADGEPKLGSPYGRAGARVGGGDRDRKPCPQRVEVKEERDRQAE